MEADKAVFFPESKQKEIFQINLPDILRIENSR